MAERGILFSKAPNDLYCLEKSFSFNVDYIKDSNPYDFWNNNKLPPKMVTAEEAKYYDEIMDRIISVQFS